MGYLQKLILFIFIVFIITACESKSAEIKKSSYDIQQCNKETYTKKDLEDYNKLIDSGEIQGYNCIGIYYMRAKNYKNARKYFEKGQSKGSLESYTQLGSLYRYFLNDDKKAVKYFTIAANNGHAKAAHNLGVYYDKNFAYTKALKWYEISFKKGDTYSLLAMGHIYRKQKNYEKAIETFEKAGELGESEAYSSLAIMYKREKSIKNFDKSIEYALKAINMGNIDAVWGLGTLYEDEFKDYDKAIEWYKKGFELGSKDSANRLGYIYWEKLKDYDKAIETFNQSYEKLNYVSGLASIGNIYATSLKNYEEAIKWYKMAYKKGNKRAAYNIGLTYQDDLKDNKNAIKWYKKAVLINMTKNISIKRLKELGINYEK